MRYVYIIRNLVNHKVYIGQTKNLQQRKAVHFCTARKGDCRHLYTAMRQYGFENFIFEVLEECVDELINQREKYWVTKFDSFNREKGYNLTSGGDHYEHTFESLQKIREARARQVFTSEHQEKKSLTLRKTNKLPEVQENRRKGQAKRPKCTKETRLKRSLSVKKAFEKEENKVKHCSICKQEGHYRTTCEVKS